MITKDQVLKALSHVDDPDLGKDIVSLNMVKDLSVEEKKVSFSIELTTPACPMKDAIHDAAKNAIRLMVDSSAEVKITMTARVKADQVIREKLKGIKNIIAVASGKGGVGKSTVAYHLALSLSQFGSKVGLLDADLHGPSIPILTGLKGKSPEFVNDRIIPLEADGIKVMSIGFMVDENQPIVWRGPMLSSGLNQLSMDVEWGELDYLIIDLPPGTGDIQLSLVQNVPLTGVVMVCTPHMLAAADCLKAIEMFRIPQINTPVLGLVENMSWFEPHDVEGKRYYPFGKGASSSLANKTKLDLLIQLPIMNETILAKPYFMELAQKVAQKISVLNHV